MSWSLVVSAELSHSGQVSNRRRNSPKSGQNRPESLCTGLWAPCRVFRALVWSSFRAHSGSKSEISGRILTSFWGSFSSAELCDFHCLNRCLVVLFIAKSSHLLSSRAPLPPAIRFSAELSHILKVSVVDEHAEIGPESFRNRCGPVCGHRAGYFGPWFGLALGPTPV